MNIVGINGSSFQGRCASADKRLKIVREPYVSGDNKGILTQYIIPNSGQLVGFVKKFDNGQVYGALEYQNAKNNVRQTRDFIVWEGPNRKGQILVKGNLENHFFHGIPMRYIPGHAPNR